MQSIRTHTKELERKKQFWVSFLPAFSPSSLPSTGIANCFAEHSREGLAGQGQLEPGLGTGASGLSALTTHGPLLPHRYLGKEGWAPASYLKKAKDDLPARKKNLAGPVEIIGNIMEISNLLNKKASGDKETPPAEGEGPEAPITKKEISLPILCNASNGSALGVPERTVSKLAQGSPAVARIAPQRAQISKSLAEPWVLAAKQFVEWAWGTRKARQVCRTPLHIIFFLRYRLTPGPLCQLVSC